MDLLRALMIRRQGHYFLRGGLCAMSRLSSALVGDDDVLPRDWGSLNRRLYRMFHGTVLPTILRNFDRLSMAHGIEVRMPFMDWRLVTYTMALPEASKSSDGYTKMIARRAMANQMPESIRMGRRKVGFNSPMPEWLNGPLSGLDGRVAPAEGAGVRRTGGRAGLRKTVSRLTASKTWDWEIGRPDLAVSQHEICDGEIVRQSPDSASRLPAGLERSASGAVRVGRGTTIAWRRLKHMPGNQLSVGERFNHPCRHKLRAKRRQNPHRQPDVRGAKRSRLLSQPHYRRRRHHVVGHYGGGSRFPQHRMGKAP